MATPYYKPKRKADLIRHLITEHQRDHIVSGPNGSRVAEVRELERLYGLDWQTAGHDLLDGRTTGRKA